MVVISNNNQLILCISGYKITSTTRPPHVTIYHCICHMLLATTNQQHSYISHEWGNNAFSIFFFKIYIAIYHRVFNSSRASKKSNVKYSNQFWMTSNTVWGLAVFCTEAVKHYERPLGFINSTKLFMWTKDLIMLTKLPSNAT